MKKVVRLTEADLVNIVKRVISEQSNPNVENDTLTSNSSLSDLLPSVNPKFDYPKNLFIIQGLGMDPFQYKQEGNNYYYAKKGNNPKWIIAKNKNAINAIKKKFSSTNQPNLSINKDSLLKRGIESVVSGFTNWVRKIFPNVAQLFFAKDLSENDFTSSQLDVMRKVVNNAIKRTGKNIGSTEYIDYGDVIVDKWFGPGGVSTTSMITNTLMSNPTFMVATTLGRFSYSVKNGEITITDIYDFKKIPDAKTTKENLEGLTYPEKVYKVMVDNDVNPYVAIRHLGYLEYPEGNYNSKPKIKISLPNQTTV